MKEKWFFSPSILEKALRQTEEGDVQYPCPRIKALPVSQISYLPAQTQMIKPCQRFSLCFQDSSHCHVFIYYCASKPSKSLFLLLQPAFKKGKKKKKIQGTDCEAFQREEIWQVILLKKNVLSKILICLLPIHCFLMSRGGRNFRFLIRFPGMKAQAPALVL